jgi:hypothetical protein
MNYDELKKIERSYADWFKRMPFFESSQVVSVEGKWVLQINYRKGMANTTKREIATELGDVPMKWVLL